MDKLIVGLGYRKRSGKDALADMMVEKHGFQKISFADPLKRGLREMLGLSDEQLWGDEKEIIDTYWGYSPRKMLQMIGTDLMRRQFDSGVWVKATMAHIRNSDHDRFVIPDCRFPNECLAVAMEGGITVNVHRPSLGPIEDAHESEIAGSRANWMATIVNKEGEPDLMLEEIERIIEEAYDGRWS